MWCGVNLSALTRKPHSSARVLLFELRTMQGNAVGKKYPMILSHTHTHME